MIHEIVVYSITPTVSATYGHNYVKSRACGRTTAQTYVVLASLLNPDP